jgi:uncharacterized membrane protein
LHSSFYIIVEINRAEMAPITIPTTAAEREAELVRVAVPVVLETPELVVVDLPSPLGAARAKGDLDP